MPLTANQRSDILAYLVDESEAADEEIGIEFILDRWDDITNLPAREKQALRRELRQLRDQRPILRQSLDDTVARIAVVESDLGI